MPKLNFLTSDFRRTVSGATPLILKNRYFEKNPFLSSDGASLLARPGMRYLTMVGSGPIRGMHSNAGSFGGDMWIASGEELYRMKNDLTKSVVYTGLFNPTRGVVNMASTGRIGVNPEILFVADGRNLIAYPAGGAPTGVEMPEDIGVIDVAVVASYVIVIPAQEGEYIGRVYWIEPGEMTVDPLNFITAERSPDAVYGVEVYGDQFWLPGESTTEVWYPSGNLDAPMQRLQGVVLDRGSWQNTATAIHETLMLVDNNGGVFTVSGSSPQRVSNPDVEEEIRRAISAQKSSVI